MNKLQTRWGDKGMVLELEVKRVISLTQIFEIYKFEMFLLKKRYLLLSIFSLAMYNITALVLLFSSIPTATMFVQITIGQIGSILVLLTLFFAGGILADEFDKKTGLTNFTKTGRNNFFVGKTLTAFTSVLIWLGFPFIENIIFCLALFQQVPIELIYWFGYYCLVGGTYISIYLLFSSLFRSGTQAMLMSFFFVIGTAAAFGIFMAFLGLPYYFPLYAEIAVVQIFDPSTVDGVTVIDIRYVILMLLAYLVPSVILAYFRFRTRDL